MLETGWRNGLTKLDMEIVTWLRIHCVPRHAWDPTFFSFIVSTVGKYINLDENTHNKSIMDVTRKMIRIKGFGVVNEVFNVEINKFVYPIMKFEEQFGLMRISIPFKQDITYYSYQDSDNDSKDDCHTLSKFNMYRKKNVFRVGLMMTIQGQKQTLMGY